jgi:hypothetical protein
MQIAKCTVCQQNLGMDGSQPAMILMSMAVSIYREETYVTGLPERLHKCFPAFLSVMEASQDFFFIWMMRSDVQPRLNSAIGKRQRN